MWISFWGAGRLIDWYFVDASPHLLLHIAALQNTVVIPEPYPIIVLHNIFLTFVYQ